jgi:hypothetical protein
MASISEAGRGMLPIGSVKIDMEQSVKQQDDQAINRKLDLGNALQLGTTALHRSPRTTDYIQKSYRGVAHTG